MNLCKESSEEVGLRYQGLKKGDVFSWLDYHPGSVYYKLQTGYTPIVKGKLTTNLGKICGDYCRNGSVIRYPNACIQLGDPE